jgi:hypothetical protein
VCAAYNETPRACKYLLEKNLADPVALRWRKKQLANKASAVILASTKRSDASGILLWALRGEMDID